jgi:hypothetical protein
MKMIINFYDKGDEIGSWYVLLMVGANKYISLERQLSVAKEPHSKKVKWHHYFYWIEH